MESGPASVLTLLGRMALIALVIGTSVTVSATERVTLSLVFAGAIGWSFVPLVQLLTGCLLVSGSGRDRVLLLNRYFGMHWPWSLWIVVTSATFLVSPVARRFSWWITLTAVIPILWTLRLLVRFSRDELGLDIAGSWRRVVAHQAATYGIALAYILVAVALWPRILGLFE
jgi:hypothetical protein